MAQDRLNNAAVIPPQILTEQCSEANAEAILSELASVFLSDGSPVFLIQALINKEAPNGNNSADDVPKHEEMYRVLVEHSLGQYLTALKINLELLGPPGTPEGNALFSELQKLADSCMNETRTLSHLLHPPILDHLGLSAAVEW